MGEEKKKFKNLTVIWDGKFVQVEPPVAHLYYKSGPDSVRWKIKGKRPPGTRVKIMWQTESPFGMINTNSDEVLGTGNKKIDGSYTYAVLFVDQNDQVVTGMDPVIINEPGPPSDD